MNRAVAVLVALLLAVHVSLPGIPAPVPVLVAFAGVIAVLCKLIWVASGLRIEWRATPW